MATLQYSYLACYGLVAVIGRSPETSCGRESAVRILLRLKVCEHVRQDLYRLRNLGRYPGRHFVLYAYEYDTPPSQRYFNSACHALIQS